MASFEDLLKAGGKLEEESTPRFDELARHGNVEDAPSGLDSLARGFLQGVAFGHADELAAGGDALFEALTSEKSYSDAYREHRDKYRGLHEASRQANPKTYLGGELGGGVATVVLPGGAPTTLGKVAARGALEGGAYGLGSSDADLTHGDVAGAAKDAALGAGLGGVGGVAGLGLGKAVTKAAQALKKPAEEFAARRATKAAGLIQKDLNKLPEGRAEEIGRALLDKGLIKPGRTSGELLPGFKAARKEAGANIGGILDEANKASGGSGAEVRRTVSARREADEALRAAEADAERQFTSHLDTTVADALGKRQAHTAKTVSSLEEALSTLKSASGLAPTAVPHAKALRPLLSLPEKQQKAKILELAEALTTEKLGGVQAGKPSSFSAAPTAAEREALKAGATAEMRAGRIPEADPRSFAKGAGFDLASYVDSVKSKLLPELADPAFESLRKDVVRKLALYEVKARRGVSFSEANAMKTNLQKTISRFVDAPASQQTKIKLQAILDDEIEGGISKTLGAEKLGAFKDAKKAYGVTSDAVKAATSAERRATGNRWTSPSDYGTGTGAALLTSLATGGAAVPSLAMGAVAAGVHKVLRERGSSSVAWGVDSAVKKLAKTDPQALGRWGSVLSKAALRSEAAFDKAHEELLSADPEYAEMIRQAEEGGQK